MPQLKTPTWMRSFEKHLLSKRSLAEAAAAVSLISSGRQPEAVEDHPFDRHLLTLSKLYRKSRALYRAAGGRFRATLVSSSRTLSSPILLEKVIEYTPLERELFWAITDRFEKQQPATLASLKRYCSSLFHEQNHRILWDLLPSPPSTGKGALSRFMNFSESLVIVTDMALGDELGPVFGSLFQELGVIYDPGTKVRQDVPSKRAYRNYLQACLHATYLNLELLSPRAIAQTLPALYANVPMPLLERAYARAANLNRGFITKTNLTWQKRHGRKVRPALTRPNKPVLAIPNDPLDNLAQYRIAEQWFDTIGL